jgi:hypothetical protein
MAQTTRQTNLLVQQDWTKIYQTFTNADFTSYDFETLRNSMINYIKTYYPETFNDFIESSEYMALIDLVAFLGQSLAFRTDLNARENFIDTAQRRDSILKLARMLSYNPNRVTPASGMLKIDSIKTTEPISDSNGINLANATIHWNDLTNDNWLEQFTTILNSALVTSQSVGKPGNGQKINGIQTDEYSISLNPNTLPVAGFNVNINGDPVQFEAVSATSKGKTYLYQDDPTNSGLFNFLYRNDNNGNGSINTGFFVYFKQGALSSSAFNVTNAIPNNSVSIAVNNITTDDQWLYALDVNGDPQTLWSKVPSLPGSNVIFNNLTEKNLYQVNTKSGDQVDLVFGEGSFSNIPQGRFRFYCRTANGLTYSLTPDDMSSISIAFGYVGKRGTNETLTISASLKYTVTNANASPSLSSIKSAAPQYYYAQNRMINGEDYNSFPQTKYSNIQKIKAVNRTSSGVSLYLDAIDPTGSYSSTNIFSDDGAITASSEIKSTSFTFITTNDVYDSIYNKVLPIIDSTELKNYYYATYPWYDSIATDVTFSQTGNTTSASSGYLQISSVTQQVGFGISGNLQYVAPGASLQFAAPNGYYFDAQHNLKSGTPSATGDSMTFFASVTGVVDNGNITTPSLVTFGTVVPTGAILSDSNLTGTDAIVAPYKVDLSSSLITILINQILTKVNFGLTFDQVNQTWKNIVPADIGSSTDWLLKFTYNQGNYTISYRSLQYVFSSTKKTKFYFDPTSRVYDSSIGKNITDTIKILNINTKPDSFDKLDSDIIWQIYNTIVQPDGYVDDTQILVKSPATQMVGVPDYPNLYELTAGIESTRSGMYFQYKHNVPARSRIDPTPVNIIDMYILTSAYTDSYTAYLRDQTGTVLVPDWITIDDMETSFGDLDNYKAVSDTIVYNAARFKPLFGTKADPSLQATFQVVKNPNAGMTDNEVKIQVVNAINSYFDIQNWDFGDTFYFSELAAYLHTAMAPNISSILIVPKNQNLVFGNYFQINSEPWEIITSAATVNDVSVVSAVTSAQLNLGNTLIGTF